MERPGGMGGAETIRLWNPQDLPGVEVLRASYRSQSFAWHAHETFAFGVVMRGGLAFRFRGMHEVAPVGCVTLAFPGEAHTGHGMDRSGWSYRMFYADAALLEEVAREVAPNRKGLPPLLQGVVWDVSLAEAIGTLHRKVEEGTATPLELQERLQGVLERFVRCHARWDTAVSRRMEDGPAQRARTFLEIRAAERVSLAELARVAGCSPFRLVRAFRERYGLPPHTWQLQVRVRRSQELLRQGVGVAEAACVLGFVDQSHFSRVFRRIVGMTPGVYVRCVRA